MRYSAFCGVGGGGGAALSALRISPTQRRAVGTASQSAAMLSTLLAMAVERRPGVFIAQDLAAWAVGAASHSDAMLFAVSAMVVERLDAALLAALSAAFLAMVGASRVLS